MWCQVENRGRQVLGPDGPDNDCCAVGSTQLHARQSAIKGPPGSRLGRQREIGLTRKPSVRSPGQVDTVEILPRNFDERPDVYGPTAIGQIDKMNRQRGRGVLVE